LSKKPICIKCKSPNVYIQAGEYGCISCGSHWPVESDPYNQYIEACKKQNIKPLMREIFLSKYAKLSAEKKERDAQLDKNTNLPVLPKVETVPEADTAVTAPDDFKKEREDMKNKFGDLHNHLFEQLERLNNEGLKGARLQEEVNRAKAITGVAREIILGGKLTLEAMIAVKEKHINALPKMMAFEEEKT
jgi:hypothetical protein